MKPPPIIPGSWVTISPCHNNGCKRRAPPSGQEEARGGGCGGFIDDKGGDELGRGEDDEEGTSRSSSTGQYWEWLQPGIGSEILPHAPPTLPEYCRPHRNLGEFYCHPKETPVERLLFPTSGNTKAQLQQSYRPPGLGWGWTPGARNSVAAAPVFCSSEQAWQFSILGEKSVASATATSGECSPAAEAIRVVSPPPRARTGLWFALRAVTNLGRGSVLPQVSKSYMRIKDGRMTVRLLIKYLVKKLGLDNEAEVEITCRGKQLTPLLTLQEVLDNIWYRGLTSSLASRHPTEYVMTLLYCKRR